VTPVALLVAMAQGDRWLADWPEEIPVRAIFATPVFARGVEGWVPIARSAPQDICPLLAKDIAA
jgi:hypothetical protein